MADVPDLMQALQDSIARAQESRKNPGHFTAGHCQDIDGGLHHMPGECPGAILNCDGKCCS